MDPKWWTKALALEAAGKLQEAEEVIGEALGPKGEPWTAQTAELYELRCKRLAAEGKMDEARAAAKKGYEFMLAYAAGSTSGGEGTARSAEAERYQANLDAVLSNHGKN